MTSAQLGLSIITVTLGQPMLNNTARRAVTLVRMEMEVEEEAEEEGKVEHDQYIACFNCFQKPYFLHFIHELSKHSFYIISDLN